MNDLSAVTSILPTEILSVIFERVCSEPKFSAVTLGAVCSHWRETAWSSTNLWSAFHTSFLLGRENVPHRSVDLLHLYFLNARSVPVSIHLHDRPHTLPSPPDEPTVPFQDFMELIFKNNAHKLGGLSLEAVDETWWEAICDLILPEKLVNFRFLELGASATL
jgi:hypothetical protein